MSMETKKPPILIKHPGLRVRKLKFADSVLKISADSPLLSWECEAVLRPVGFVFCANFDGILADVIVTHTYCAPPNAWRNPEKPLPRYYRLETVVLGKRYWREMNQRQMREFIDKYDPPHTMAAVGG